MGVFCQTQARRGKVAGRRGEHVARGLGAGAKPEHGKGDALGDASGIEECMAGAEMVVVTAGMGGGTGAGAAPISAQVARERRLRLEQHDRNILTPQRQRAHQAGGAGAGDDDGKAIAHAVTSRA